MKKTVGIFFFLCGSLSAQDIHFSQPGNTLIYQNPAFTGASGKYSFTSSYKSQWNAANSSFNTGIISGDFRLGKETSQTKLINIGAIVITDKAGNGKFQTNSFGLTASCLLKAGEHLRLGLGMGGNLVQTGLNQNNFQWGNQFNGSSYDGSLNSNENSARVRHIYGDLNAGVSAIYSKEKDPKISNTSAFWMCGYSLNHVNSPNISLNGAKDLLYLKHTVYISGLVPMNERTSFKPMIVAYYQRKLLEITGGGFIRCSFGQISKITGINKGSGIAFGLLYRYNDAYIPTIEYDNANFTFGVSYDVNYSQLSVASKLRGGLQLSLRISEGSNFLRKKHDAQAPQI